MSGARRAPGVGFLLNGGVQDAPRALVRAYSRSPADGSGSSLRVRDALEVFVDACGEESIGGRVVPQRQPRDPLTSARLRRSGSLETLPRLQHSPASVTAFSVVVDQSHRLHEGVHGRRADEPPAAPLEILRECDGLGRGGG